MKNIFNVFTRKIGGAPVLLWLFLGLNIYNAQWHLRNYAPEKLKKDQTRYWSDAEGYYLYLPALIKGSFQDINPKTTGGWITEEGRIFSKYTYGVALLEAPFFFVTQAIVKMSNPEIADGFSWPYQLMANIIAFFYGFLGMFFIFKLLRKKHSVFVASLTVFGLTFATNFTYYLLKDPGAVHVYSMFCFAIIFWATSNYFESFKKRDLIIASFFIALVALQRPTNIVVVFFFFVEIFTG
ncbi:MAG: hypothetical protein AAGK97_13590, partial [Bacteroidota bacterium]